MIEDEEKQASVATRPIFLMLKTASKENQEPNVPKVKIVIKSQNREKAVKFSRFLNSESYWI